MDLASKSALWMRKKPKRMWYHPLVECLRQEGPNIGTRAVVPSGYPEEAVLVSGRNDKGIACLVEYCGSCPGWLARSVLSDRMSAVRDCHAFSHRQHVFDRPLVYCPCHSPPVHRAHKCIFSSCRRLQRPSSSSSTSTGQAKHHRHRSRLSRSESTLFFLRFIRPTIRTCLSPQLGSQPRLCAAIHCIRPPSHHRCRWAQVLGRLRCGASGSGGRAQHHEYPSRNAVHRGGREGDEAGPGEAEVGFPGEACRGSVPGEARLRQGQAGARCRSRVDVPPVPLRKVGKNSRTKLMREPCSGRPHGALPWHLLPSVAAPPCILGAQCRR